MTSLTDTKRRTRITPYSVMGGAMTAVTGRWVDQEVVPGGSHLGNAGIAAFAADPYALVRRDAG